MRALRSTAAILLVLSLTLLLGLFVLGGVPTAREALAPLIWDPGESVSGVAAVLTLVFILVAPIALFIAARRRRWVTWRTLSLGWAAAIGVFVWLGWDEGAIRRPMTIEEIAPAFDGAEHSYTVLMRYSRQTPSAEAQAFAEFTPALKSFSSPREPDKWQEFITANRAAIEADWAALAPQRQWLTELNGFARIGDLGPARFDSNIMRFDVWRTLAQRACAMASLQALDGKPDEAFATVLPYLEVARKLEPSARTLVRMMIARVVQRLSLETLTFILNHHPVPPALRPRLLAALGGGNSAAGARRLVVLEFPTFAGLVSSLTLADRHLVSGREQRLRGVLALASPFLFNPIATVNAYGDHLHEVAALAEAREVGKLAVREHGFGRNFADRRSPKNIGGRLLLNLVNFSVERVVRSYWEIEDMRIALHSRIATMPAR